MVTATTAGKAAATSDATSKENLLSLFATYAGFGEVRDRKAECIKGFPFLFEQQAFLRAFGLQRGMWSKEA